MQVRRQRWGISLALLSSLWLAGCGANEAPTPLAQSDQGGADSIQVTLCDNETRLQVDAGAPITRETGQTIAGELMRAWQAKNPQVDWAEDERRAHTLQPSYDNGALVETVEEGTYSRFSQTDIELWKRETERVALAGSRIFHSADELGSSIAVSCDMCHPHGANTHPETYPKFQTQLGRVVLLRDMINWCIEHPVRGQRLSTDSPQMRALEAYIMAQRAGVPMAYGKH